MKQLIVSISILFLPTLGFSQTYYEKGTAYLQNEEYAKADSMFTLAINALPFGDSYYNRAIARLKMNNMEGFCKDMKKASANNDAEAEKLHCQYCLDIDTLYYDADNTISDIATNYFEIIKQEKYYDLTEGYIYKKK